MVKPRESDANSGTGAAWNGLVAGLMPQVADKTAEDTLGTLELRAASITLAVRSWLVSKRVPKPKGGLAAAPCRGLDARLGWTVLEAAADDFLSVHERLGEADGMVYFANRFHVPVPRVWGLRLGYDGGVKVFVDGETVLVDPETRNPAFPGRMQVEMPLARGDHEVVIAFDTAAGKGWGIFFAWVLPRLDIRLPAPGDDRG